MDRIKIELSHRRVGDNRNLSPQPYTLKKIPGFGQNPVADVNRIGAVSEVYS